jgi:hypothetical protein
VRWSSRGCSCRSSPRCCGCRSAGASPTPASRRQTFRLLRANPIFAPLSIATLEGLAVQLDRRRAAPGEMIVASFGEIALLRDVPRTATVLAVEATELRALSHERFLLAVTGEPDSHDAARQLADRLLTSPQAEVQYPSLGAIHLHASGFKFGAWQSIHAQ